MIDKENSLDLLNQFDEKESLYKDFLKYFYNTITGILKNRSITVQSVDTRLKKRDSLDKKIKLKKKYKELEEITDVCGMRIITYFSDDVDKIADIINEEFEIDLVNSVDKRKSEDPTKFGYVSLHYIVSLKGNRAELPEAEMFKNLKIEIQIRTILQHAWAEIEHDLGYKTVGDIPSSIRRKFSLLAGQIELADETFVTIKEDMERYSKEVLESIDNDGEELLIDIVSIDAFIKKDKEYISRLMRLSKENGINIEYSKNNESKKYLSNIINNCNDLGIKTISELKEIFQRYEDLLTIPYAENGLSGFIDSVPLGDIIRILHLKNNTYVDKNEFSILLDEILEKDFIEAISDVKTN